jgi:hypothetical protein
MRRLYLNDVTGIGCFATSCAKGGNFHRDGYLGILRGLKQPRLRDFRSVNTLSYSLRRGA